MSQATNVAPRGITLYLSNITALKCFLVFAAGCCLPLAFAPYEYWALAFVAPLVLLWACKNVPASHAFIFSLIFGIGLFAIGMIWLKPSIKDICVFSEFVSIVVAGGLVLVLAFFTAMAGYCFNKLSKNYTATSLMLAFPAYWVIFEWMRGTILSGFPWMVIGYTQLDTVLSSYAPIVSVLGVSWIVLFNVGALYYIIFERQAKPHYKLVALIASAALWGGGFALQDITWTKIDDKPHSVAIIQPNISVFIKNQLSVAEHWQYLHDLTMQALGAELVLWPELTITVPLPYSKNYVDFIGNLAKAHNTTVMLGTFSLASDQVNNYPVNMKIYNSLQAVGLTEASYKKQHLVPLGETLAFAEWMIPLVKKLGRNRSTLEAMQEPQDLIRTPNSSALPVICYEIIFYEEVRTRIKANPPQVIINISEDGWLDNTSGMAQHFQMVRMRALETGRYVLRSAGSGISAVINNKGKVVASCPTNSPQIIKSQYYNAAGYTPWTHLGTPVLIPAMLILALLVYILNRRKSKVE